ncbi:MAG TPA: hypothetical protein VHG53_03925 [Candidatus Limnocylindria bacterium]|nr:hypothetical protein [Candidatus Limnocylindria bacterium]
MGEPSGTAEFPLPADVTDDERAQAVSEIGKHVPVVATEPRAVRFRGRLLGQTGPNWHFQYTRIYALERGFLAAGHDIREGIKVSFADDLAHVADGFENEGVREFIEDELRFRKLLDVRPTAAH